MSDLAIKVASKDQLKTLKKKIEILKTAVLEQRKQKDLHQHALNLLKEKVWKQEAELKKKEQKNELLLAEIRDLKDALIVERNERQQELKDKAENKPEPPKSALSMSNYFGLKSLWK